MVPSVDPFSDYANNRLNSVQVATNFVKNQSNSIICIPMLKSIQSQVSNVSSYFNATQVSFVPNSNLILVSVYNAYSYLF